MNNPQYYSTKSEEKTDSDEDKYITYTYEAVPVKVTVKGIEKRYVDTSKGSSSFLANDYYSDINQLNNLHNNPSSM
ncbi:MAG: hypothetical protein MJ223_04170 [Mycoplasmoidaceae bacterium]|nr:hypothetical protein [Mycoplasmoidaceae bacterium]